MRLWKGIHEMVSVDCVLGLPDDGVVVDCQGLDGCEGRTEGAKEKEFVNGLIDLFGEAVAPETLPKYEDDPSRKGIS